MEHDDAISFISQLFSEYLKTPRRFQVLMDIVSEPAAGDSAFKLLGRSWKYQ